MGIHRLAFIGIFLAKAHIGYLVPLPGKRFTVAVLYSVEAMGLYVIEQTDGILQCFRISGGPVIFAQTINGKTDGVNLFFGIQRLTPVIKRPINSSELRIIKTVDKVTFGPGCHLFVFFFAQQAVSGRVGPQNTCMQNGSFLCLRHPFFLSGDTSVKSTVFLIHHPFHPVGKDVGGEFFQHFLFKNLVHSILNHD